MDGEVIVMLKNCNVVLLKHSADVHEKVIDPHNNTVHRENKESMRLHAKRKLKRGFCTSCDLFQIHLLGFNWKMNRFLITLFVYQTRKIMLSKICSFAS